MKKTMYILIFILIVIAGTTVIILNQAKFGKAPLGDRLERIRKSANYKDGAFQNQHFTPMFAEGVSKMEMIKSGIFKVSKRKSPEKALPSKKTNLKEIDPSQNVLVWFGHSSYFMQIDGKRMLVDPVLSGSASPFSFMVKSFEGSDVYSPTDFPPIDYLFITHDHWDHLDHLTIMKLKVGKVITSLGTGAHFELWGFAPDQIIELDWDQQSVPDSGFTVTATPGRHFSGRSFKRNQAFWASFVLQTPTKKIFIGGDSGYDTHFAQIGNEHGPFDLALLECGQYNKAWKYIHMMPEETVKAAIDLKTKYFMPVHWGKFALALHAWDESIERVTKEATRLNVPIRHPMIGETLDLDEPQQTSQWWKGLN